MSPFLAELYWWVKFFVCIATGASVLWKLADKIAAIFDKHTKAIVAEVFSELSAEMMRYFNAQLAYRDQQIQLINRKLTAQGHRITGLALAGANHATVGLWPGNPPSRKEKEKVVEEYRKILGDTDDLQIP